MNTSIGTVLLGALASFACFTSVCAGVPLGYEQYPFVQFDQAGAYIDTGIVIDNHRIQFKFEDFDYGADRHYIGTVTFSTYVHFTSYNNAWYWGNSGRSEGHAGVYSTGVHEVDFNNGSRIYLDGALLSDETVTPGSNGGNLLIGSRTKVANFVGRFYYLRILNQDGTEVANLVPVREKNSGEIGFYDVVNSRFCGNDGGGELSLPTIDHVNVVGSPLDYGTCEPDYGVQGPYADGERVVFSAPRTVTNGTVIAGCIGWQLVDDFSGAVVGSGVGNRVDYVHAGMTSRKLVWKWITVDRALSPTDVGALGNGYKLVRYLRFGGKADCDTQYVVAQGDTLEFTFATDKYVNDGHVLGFGNNAKANSLSASNLHLTMYNDRWYWGYDGKEGNGGSYSNGLHTVSYGANGKMTVDGAIIGDADGFTSCDYTLAIGSRGPYNNFEGDFYGLQIFDGAGALTANLVPVVELQTEKKGFYDLKRRVFCECRGTGAVTCGPEEVSCVYDEIAGEAEGESVQFGAPFLPYGIARFDVGDTAVLFMPEKHVEVDGEAWSCAGYDVYTNTLYDATGDWVVERSGRRKSFTFVQGDHPARIVWRWKRGIPGFMLRLQ